MWLHVQDLLVNLRLQSLEPVNFMGCAASTRLSGASSQAALLPPHLPSPPLTPSLGQRLSIGPDGTRRAKTLFATGNVSTGPPSTHECLQTPPGPADLKPGNKMGPKEGFQKGVGFWTLEAHTLSATHWAEDEQSH